MGALTSNRKRVEDFNVTSVPISPSYDQSRAHIAKKPKISSYTGENIQEDDRFSSLYSVRSRIALYPDPKSRGFREVHAPVRRSRVRTFFEANKRGLGASSKKSTAKKVGSFFVTEFRNAKFSAARFFKRQNDVSLRKQKEKEVIQIKDDEVKSLIDVSDDSGIEEAEVVDALNCKWKEEHWTPEKSPKDEIKYVEKEPKSLDSSILSDVSYVNTKLNVVEKRDLILLDQQPDASEFPVHKKLYDSSKRRDGKLHSLNFLIGFYEKIFEGLRLQFLGSRKKEEQIKDVASECFIPLTEEEEDDIDSALSNFYRRKILVSHKNSNIDISGEILRCLSPGQWLNDEVINVYLELLKERESKDPEKFLKCHFFNTFFYKKLISGRGGYNFQSVRRWTTHKKLGYSLLECDKIFVPIHQEIHWCLAVINKKDEKFQYLDSLEGVDSQVLNILARYYVDEVKEKCGKDLNVSSWEHEFVTDLPKQENGFDCGVFMVKYADFYSRDIGLCFSQQHMPYFRRRMAKEILKLRAE